MTNLTNILISILATFITASTFLLVVTFAAYAHPEHTHHCHVDYTRCH